MKRTFALLSLVIIVVCINRPVMAQAIPDGDFETWTNVSGVEKPSGGWDISDEAGLGCTPYSSIKTTDKATGSYAILLETNNCINFGGIHEGYAQISYSTTAKPDSVKFRYKATRLGRDSGLVDVWIYNNSTPIGHAQRYIDSTKSTYQQVSLPIRYFFPLEATTINILLSSDADWNPKIGNRLWIDDLQFVTIPSAVGNSYNNNLKTLSCFPMPATANLNISFSLVTGSDVTITLRDITGIIIHTSSSYCPAGNNTIPVNIASIPTGIYICEVQAANGEKAIERIIKQ